MRNILRGAALGAVLLTAACGGETYELSGQVVLESDDNVVGEENGQEACRGGGGYADIIGGEDVVVYNGGGEEIARTQLQLGQPRDGGFVCVFPFVFPELPEEDAYAVVVGDRDPVPYSLSELRGSDFNIQLTLDEAAA